MLKANKAVSVLLALSLLIVCALVYFITRDKPDIQNHEDTERPQLTPSNPDNNKPSIATEWQWQAPSEREAPSKTDMTPEAKHPFTAESVYNALQAVKIDEDGNIVLDHDALLSLDETLERIHNRLDKDSLSALQTLIKEALPGKAGEQTAKIVGDYHQFLDAKEEFSRLNETVIDPDSEGTLASLQRDANLYKELQTLREVHIGKEATDKLFRVSDANAHFMFDSMKLEYDTDLTPAEAESKRKRIEARHIEQSVNITDWPERYKAFLDNKQNITSAQIGTEEKTRQLTESLQQHFNEEELGRIRHLELDKVNDVHRP